MTDTFRSAQKIIFNCRLRCSRVYIICTSSPSSQLLGMMRFTVIELNIIMRQNHIGSIQLSLGYAKFLPPPDQARHGWGANPNNTTRPRKVCLVERENFISLISPRHPSSRRYDTLSPTKLRPDHHNNIHIRRLTRRWSPRSREAPKI